MELGGEIRGKVTNETSEKLPGCWWSGGQLVTSDRLGILCMMARVVPRILT